MRKLFSGIVLALLLACTLAVAFNVRPVNSVYIWNVPIYIRADGIVSPSSAPIQKNGSIYTLTGNIVTNATGIIVLRSNVTIDGAGYALNQSGQTKNRGFDLTGINQVVIKNIKIANFGFGIEVDSSSNNTFNGNTLASNGDGIHIEASSNYNNVSGNNITDNGYGIYIDSSFNNIASENNITANKFGGIYLYYSDNNKIIAGNNVTDNNIYGLYFESSSNNTVSGNNITNNSDAIELYLSANNTVSGNNITANSQYGIILDGSSNNSISGNNVRANNGYGISLNESSYNNVNGNNVTDNKWEGIILDYSSNNSVNGDNLASNGGGVYLEYSLNNTVNRNNVTDNDLGIWLALFSNYNSISSNKIANSTNYGLMLGNSNHNNVTGNMFVYDGLTVANSFSNTVNGNFVNGKPLVYLENASDSIVGDAGQVVLIKSNRITVENLTLSQTDIGIELEYTSNTKISHNNISATNWYGIYLFSCSNDTVSGNNITACRYRGIYLSSSSQNGVSGNNITNDQDGIYVEVSYNNLVSGNTVANNGHNGIFLDAAQNNTIYHNNFINNTNQANSTIPNSINVWDDGYPSGGNYWSDYTGTDLHSGPYQNLTRSDGIGDTAYTIDSNSIDNYPLMGMYYEFNVSLLHNKTGIVTVIGGSTVSNLTLAWWLSSPYDGLQPGQPFIHFFVAGENNTAGFCRITLPKYVLNATSYVVLVNWQPVNATLLPFSNSTYDYLYFTYNNSKEEIVVTIPEFGSVLILPLMMMATLLTVITYKKKAKNARPPRQSSPIQ